MRNHLMQVHCPPQLGLPVSAISFIHSFDRRPDVAVRFMSAAPTSKSKNHFHGQCEI